MFPGQNLISQMLPYSRDIRFRQAQQMAAGGAGQDFSPGREYANPSGPDALGLGPARSVEGQYRSDFRDTMRDMPKGLSFALGMVPGIGKAFSLARAVDYAMGKAAESRNAIANQQMSENRQTFRTSEIADLNAPMQNTPQQTFQTGERAYANQGTTAGSGYGGGADAPGANADGFGGGDAGFGGGSQAFAQGGMVRLKDLLGKAPGPDDGYGALQDGEFVIKKDAVKRYGVKMLEQINRRKIAKKQVSKFFKNHG